jgi:molybdenum cofactor guanylyltransferase
MQPRSGAILAGGESRRFGSDKAFAVWEGETLLARALATLAPFGPVRVIAGSVERAERLRAALPAGVIVLPDDTPGRGALGGLATALRAAEPGSVAVLAVDLPRIRSAYFAHLQAAAPAQARAIAARHADGRWEPLAALYHTSLATHAADPTRSARLQRFLDDVGAHAVEPGPFADELANVNHRADLQALGAG